MLEEKMTVAYYRLQEKPQLVISCGEGQGKGGCLHSISHDIVIPSHNLARKGVENIQIGRRHKMVSVGQ